MDLPYTATALGFLFLTWIMYSLVARELRKSIGLTPWNDGRKKKVYSRFVLGLTVWVLFLSIASYLGFFSDFSSFPLRIIIVLLVPLATILLVVFSETTKELLPLIPAANIVRLQVFRFFVELLLWAAFVQNLLPVQMTFEGRNFDVLAGITAPVVAYFFIDNHKLLLVWNLLSLGLLINIVTIALLSIPTPFRVFMNEPANTLVALFPFILLPGMLVPLAYGLHFLSLRQLKLTQKG